MKLMLVESPTKCRTLKKILGKDYQIAATMGHIRDLPKSDFGIDIEQDFKPKYIIPLKARKTVNLLKKEVQKANLIILAVDEDREGEAIAWHLTQALNLDKEKSYQRIVFHEITKPAIEEALKSPQEINKNLVDAQQARRILDRIVGYKLSPFLWKKVTRRLSAGRVQSVAVRLIVEREREIQNFLPQEYWNIEALLKKILNLKSEILNKSQIQNLKSQTELKALLVKKNDKIIPKLGIKTKKEANKILKDLKGVEYTIENVERKEIKRNPLPPFTTSTLQQESWQRFRFPAKLTMGIAQNLYERGLITYHRTDSLNLSDLSLFVAKKFICEKYGKNYWAGFLRKYKTKTKSAQEAHEAIRPSYPDKSPETLKLETQQLKLYQIIWQRFIACQMSQAIFDSTNIEIEASSKSKILNSKQIPKPNIQNSKYIFKASGQILKFDGFLKVYPIKFKETELPPLETNETLELLKLISSQHFTHPPPRYNEATLIKLLEENGIGRPSTYAPTLSTIQERNYIEKNEQKRFQPTEIGFAVNNLLVAHFPKIVDIGFTSEMEEKLDKIAQGIEEWTPIIRKFYTEFEENLQKKYQEISKKDIAEEKTDKICVKCSSPLIIKLGRFGKFYACTRFPKCRHTESLEKNTLGIKCSKCNQGEIVEKRTKKRKIFYGCNHWPKCDFALWDKPLKEKCPECQALLVQTNRRQIKCADKKCKYKRV